jgi:hypothetical protein
MARGCGDDGGRELWIDSAMPLLYSRRYVLSTNTTPYQLPTRARPASQLLDPD